MALSDVGVAPRRCRHTDDGLARGNNSLDAPNQSNLSRKLAIIFCIVHSFVHSLSDRLMITMCLASQSVAPISPLAALRAMISGGTTMRNLSYLPIKAPSNAQSRCISLSRIDCPIFWKKGTEYRGVDPFGGDNTRCEVARANPCVTFSKPVSSFSSSNNG